MNSKCMYFEPSAGLGNRLFAMASAMYVFQQCNMNKLIIVWKKELACAVDFDDIFSFHLHEENVEIKSVYQMGWKSGHWLQKLLSNSWLKRTKRKCKLYDICNDINLVDASYESLIPEMKNYDKCYVSSWKPFVDEDILSDYLRKLSFRDDLYERARQNVPDTTNTIGLQIRRTDHAKAIQLSPMSMFVDIIENSINRNPDLQIFVSTDDDSVYNQLIEKYPQNIIKKKTISDKVSRITNEGMMDAVVDMLSLARCNKLYLSYTSTFGTCAQILGNVEYEIVRME